MGRWMAALFIASCTGCAASHTRSTELDDFTSEYAEAWCTRVARCGNEWWLETQLGATLGDCPTQLEARVAESDVGTRATAVHEGSVVYHRERVAACLDEIATGDCFGLGVDPCDAVFEGRLAVGEPCDIDAQCVSTARCVTEPGATCPRGVCRSFPQDGEACLRTTSDRTRMCASRSYCAVPDGASEGTCAPSRQRGETCGTAHDECFGALVCVPEAPGATRGTCGAPVRGEGEACGIGGCAPGLVCGTGGLGRVCRRPRTDGTCEYAPFGPEDCPTGQRCDATATAPDGRCAPFPSEGETCIDRCAYPVSCAREASGVGACMRLRRVGEPCAYDGACEGGRCTEGVCTAPRLCAE
ncbi:MAG: hypothetical protein U0234_29495 [Sandaracinus sp.]